METIKPVKLKNLINYQKDSVVSREIIKKPAGTVTLFAFAQGQGLSEHKTPFTALVYLLDGKAEITLSSQKHLLKEGEMLIMPANQPHTLYAVKKFKMLLVMLDSNSC